MTGREPLDLTPATEAAVASVDIAHEDWCCAVGCAVPGGHWEITPPVDDGSGSMVMVPGTRKTGHCAGTDDDCTCWRRIALACVREAVEAAAPLIEAAVRADAAEAIEDYMRDLNPDWSNDQMIAVLDALDHALAIVRGEV